MILKRLFPTRIHALLASCLMLHLPHAFAAREMIVVSFEPRLRSCQRGSAPDGSHLLAVMEWEITLINHSNIAQTGYITMAAASEGSANYYTGTAEAVSYVSYMCGNDAGTRRTAMGTGLTFNYPSGNSNFTVAARDLVTLYVGAAVSTTSPLVTGPATWINTYFRPVAVITINEDRGAVSATARANNRGFNLAGNNICVGGSSIPSPNWSCWGFNSGEPMQINGGRPF